MADIAAGDVTYTLGQAHNVKSRGYQRRAVIAFGDGALTYPSGGVPLTKAKLGCPNNLDNLLINDDPALGLVYKFDRANAKIRIYEVDTTGDTDKALVELDAGSDAPAATSLNCEAIGY